MSDRTSARERRIDVCCTEFGRAVEITFANYRDDETGWFLFGTDHDSAIAGSPEVGFWAIRHCPFCGERLRRPERHQPRGPWGPPPRLPGSV